jgi:hypothetical protein
MSDYCFECGGNGFPDRNCPSCHKPALNKVKNIEDIEDKDAFIKSVSAISVPEKYIGIFWNSTELEKSHVELLGEQFGIEGRGNDWQFVRFIDNLKRVNDAFSDKKLPSKSAIIVAPAGFSKMVFAYSCMQKALSNGFTVAPLLNTIELKRLIVLAAENPRYKLNNCIDFDEYIMSDVCFITVTKMHQREWAYEVIQEIMDIRSRKGLSTFVMSRFDINEISYRDRSNSFDIIKRKGTDSYKYPAIIRYLGGISQ